MISMTKIQEQTKKGRKNWKKRRKWQKDNKLMLLKFLDNENDELNTELSFCGKTMDRTRKV